MANGLCGGITERMRERSDTVRSEMAWQKVNGPSGARTRDLQHEQPVDVDQTIPGFVVLFF